MPEKRPAHRDPHSKPRPWKFIGAVATAFLIAIVTAIGTGFGSDIFGHIRGNTETKLVSYSATEQVIECGTPLFVPGSAAASGRLPLASDWPAFKRSNNASVASPSIVNVSIQGETARTITLTRINYSVVRRTRPPGGIFAIPCGDSTTGRFVEADFDRKPIAVIDSSKEPGGVVGGVDSEGRSANKPIAFPWTVSVTDGLTLDVVGVTKRCLCLWRAYITWQSGGKTGIIKIDNGGQGYPVVGARGTPYFIAGNHRWEHLPG